MSEKLTEQYIDEILNSSKIEKVITHSKIVTLNVTLPNGYVISANGAVVDWKNFNDFLGYETALKIIRDKVRELEGYLFQEKSYQDREWQYIFAKVKENQQAINT